MLHVVALDAPSRVQGLLLLASRAPVSSSSPLLRVLLSLSFLAVALSPLTPLKDVLVFLPGCQWQRRWIRGGQWLFSRWFGGPPQLQSLGQSRRCARNLRTSFFDKFTRPELPRRDLSLFGCLVHLSAESAKGGGADKERTGRTRRLEFTPNSSQEGKQGTQRTRDLFGSRN